MDRYEMIKEIDSGGYGEIFLATDVQRNEEVVLKRIPFTDSGDLSIDAIRESYILTELKHDNIARLERTFVHDNYVFLVLQKYEMNLILHFRWKEKSYPTMIKKYLKQILSALHYCHSHGVIHRDLKPENILFWEGNDRMVIADFGCARGLFCQDMILTPEAATLSYGAPEILLGSDHYTPAVDIWSFGCIFSLMIDDKKKILFKGDSEIEVLHRIFSILGTPTEDSWPGVSALPEFSSISSIVPSQGLDTIFPTLEPAAFDLLSRCLCLNPAHRISAHDALEHDFLRDISLKDSTADALEDSTDALEDSTTF